MTAEGKTADGYDFRQVMSEENAFLTIILLCVVALGIILMATRNKRSNRALDSQVTKYQSLNAQHSGNSQLV